MTDRMDRANIIFLAVIAVATVGLFDLLKSQVGGPLSYAVGAVVVGLLVASLLRK